MLDVRLHLGNREVAGIDQTLLQLQQFVLRVVISDVPGNETLHECGRELATLETGFGKAMAMAGLPEQGDVRAVAGALNLDTVCLQFRIEETDADQRGMDRGLAALVKGMVKRLALARRKGAARGPDAAHRVVIRRQAFDFQVQAGDGHRGAGIHLQACGVGLAVLIEF